MNESGSRACAAPSTALLAVMFVAAAISAAAAAGTADAPATRRPNLLLAIADDWGFPHAGAYGDAVVKTPAFDRLAREGVLFTNAYASSPSCTPSRGALLTGQWHWRLKGAANLWSIFPDAFATYPEILAKAGYVAGSTGKAWGPGRTETPKRELAGAKRSAEELYDLRKDPAQLVNIAGDPACAEIRAALAARLTEFLRASGDPRVVGGAEAFESHPYLGGGVPYEEPRKK